MTALTYRTPDKTAGAREPQLSLIGTMLQHNGNLKTYIVTGFCWLGASDSWGFLHQEVTDDGLFGVVIARPLSHIEGKMKNGTARFSVALF